MRLKAAAVVLLACGIYGTAQADPPGAPDDHFLFYKAKVSKDTTAFAPISATLANAFDNATYTVKKPVNLCTPASKDGGVVTDSNTHLVAYSIKLASGTAHIPQTNIKVVDQFSVQPALRVNTLKPDLLLVPSSKTLMPPPAPPPNLGAINVDHYVCYKIKITKDTPKFIPHTIKGGNPVSVADQFTTAKNYDLKKPKHLCVPTSVNGGGIKRASGYLMCYTAKVSKTSPASSPHTGLNVNNEFVPNPLQLDTGKETELCAPAIINSVCGDNLKNDPAEECDGTDATACPGDCSQLCQCRQHLSFVLDPPESKILVRGASALGAGVDNDFSPPISGFSGTIMVNVDGLLSPNSARYQISVPVTTLPPLDITVQPFGTLARVCVSLQEDPNLPGSGLSGIGLLSCFGGFELNASTEFNLHLDHCTNGTACDSGMPGGCPGDLNNGGKIHAGTGLCVPAAPNDTGCTNTGFGGSTAKLETSPDDPHPGTCNSPLYGISGSGSFLPGDVVITLNAAIEIVNPGDPCSGLPTFSGVKGPLTTGTASSTIMDAFPGTAPFAGKVQAISVTGVPFTCDVTGHPTGTSGAKLVTAVAVVDVPLPSPLGLADLNAALILTAQ